MEAQVGDIVIPGDIVNDKYINCAKMKVILGPGLRHSSGKVITCTSGVLKKKNPKTFCVDNHQKRYVPASGETVVGVIAAKGGDIFKVDIGSSEQASLSYLAFEGATKKYRPDIQVGDVVFAKLVMANQDMEPELVCIDSFGKAGSLGGLPADGFLFTCSLNLVRKILRPQCNLLKILGREIPHEIAIGVNGKIWLKAKTVKETIAVANAILASEHITNEKISDLCDDIVRTLARK